MPEAKAKAKKKARRRKKHCPVCEEEVSMTVTREAEDEDDLWWLICSECESRFVLTRQQYQKEKKPDISAVKASKAKEYCTDKTYKVGQIIHHSKLDDVGIVTDKASAPSTVDCSGSIIVSFMELGQKRLIEGYNVA
jgi:transcription elongation factor Elf1